MVHRGSGFQLFKVGSNGKILPALLKSRTFMDRVYRSAGESCEVMAKQPPFSKSQPNNPLHGVKLEDIVCRLVDYYGWSELGEMIPVRCFTHDPSVKSSLAFLRKTPWAREKVEQLYLYMIRR